MDNTICIGREGEDQAVIFLTNLGYTLLDRNYRYKHGEIDCVFMNKNIMVFVEVKYRKNNDYGHPEKFISKQQIRSIQDTAEQYLKNKNWHGQIRFDIIAITEGEPICHLQDCFT